MSRASGHVLGAVTLRQFKITAPELATMGVSRMSNQIDIGVEQGLIGLDVDQKYITYIAQGKRLRYSDPEEKIRANAYLSLVLEYGYAPEQIDIEFTVPHRVPNIYTDIVVFAEKTRKATT
jgi:type I restriction enzyme M protein